MVATAPGAPLGASYTLVSLVGKGASGQVWSVQHARQKAPLVAKILHSHLAEDAEVVERFVRERSVLMGLEHRHIVTVHDLVVEGSTLALVMDYYGGGSLRDVLAQQGTVRPAVALRLVATVLETLAYAHGQGVVHRDIKPDNILFEVESEQLQPEALRVTDFGISSIIRADQTNTTGIVGTPYYLPPELIQSGTSGPAGDVYSTGIMLYELLAGRTPFAGEGTEFTVAYRHVTTEVPPLELPEPVMQELLSLLDKNPARRPHPFDAAARLRTLADRFEKTPALAPVEDPQAFTEAHRPQTVVRGMSPASTSDDIQQVEDSAAPVLGPAAGATIIRPQQVERPVRQPEPDADAEVEGAKKPRSKAMWLGIAGVLLLLGTGFGIYWAVTSSSAPSEPFSAAGSQESPLPTGLSVRREATYNPSSSTIDLTITYSAQKAPLSGEFLEVVPAVAEGGSCPNVTWNQASGERNQPMVTDMNVECGWTLQDIDIKPNQQVEVTGSVAAQVADLQQLEGWLESVSEQTRQAISSEEYKSTSYPVQRLTDVVVKVPARTVGQSAVPITLLPVWPSGEDSLNPLFSSERAGKPSGMLQAVAGDENPVRFSDGCAGHLMVDASGLKVTALSVANQCAVNAQVGNFTDLRSSNFTISTRD